MGEQQNYYRKNEAYADFLENWDTGFYAKFADSLCPAEAGGKALDIGCGVGQVVQLAGLAQLARVRALASPARA